MTVLVEGSVQDKVARRPRKAARRRVVPAPSSMNLVFFSLICVFALIEFAVAVAAVFGIEALYHLFVYGSIAAIVEPWLTALSFATAYVALYAFRFSYAPASMRRGGVSSVVTSWLLAAAIVIIIAFLGKVSELYSRGSTIAVVIAGPLVLLVARHAMISLLGRMARIRPYLFRRVLLIGTEGEIEPLGLLVERHGDCRVVASFCLRSDDEKPGADTDLGRDDEDVELAKSL